MAALHEGIGADWEMVMEKSVDLEALARSAMRGLPVDGIAQLSLHGSRLLDEGIAVRLTGTRGMKRRKG